MTSQRDATERVKELEKELKETKLKHQGEVAALNGKLSQAAQNAQAYKGEADKLKGFQDQAASLGEVQSQLREAQLEVARLSSAEGQEFIQDKAKFRKTALVSLAGAFLVAIIILSIFGIMHLADKPVSIDMWIWAPIIGWVTTMLIAPVVYLFSKVLPFAHKYWLPTTLIVSPLMAGVVALTSTSGSGFGYIIALCVTWLSYTVFGVLFGFGARGWAGPYQEKASEDTPPTDEAPEAEAAPANAVASSAGPPPVPNSKPTSKPTTKASPAKKNKFNWRDIDRQRVGGAILDLSLVFGTLAAIVYQPFTDLLAWLEVDLVTQWGQEATVNAGKGTIGTSWEFIMNSYGNAALLFLVIALMYLLAFYIWTEAFPSVWGPIHKERLLAYRHKVPRIVIAKAVVLVASLVVGYLVLSGLWPIDGSKKQMVLAIVVAGIAVLAFNWLKFLLFDAGHQGRSFGGVLGLSLLVLCLSGTISASFFYESNTREVRLYTAKDIVKKAAGEHSAIITGLMEVTAREADTKEEKDEIRADLLVMETAMSDVTLAVTFNEIIEAVDRYRNAAAKYDFLIMEEEQKGSLGKVVVPRDASPIDLLQYAIIGGDEPPSVLAVRDTGAIIMSFIFMLMAEFMALFMFFGLLSDSRSRKKANMDKAPVDGSIISIIGGQTVLVNFVLGLPPGTQIGVLNGEEQVFASFQALETDAKVYGDGVTLCQGKVGDKVKKGMDVRIL